ELLDVGAHLLLIAIGIIANASRIVLRLAHDLLSLGARLGERLFAICLHPGAVAVGLLAELPGLGLRLIAALPRMGPGVRDDLLGGLPRPAQNGAGLFADIGQRALDHRIG